MSRSANMRMRAYPCLWRTSTACTVQQSSWHAGRCIKQMAQQLAAVRIVAGPLCSQCGQEQAPTLTFGLQLWLSSLDMLPACLASMTHTGLRSPRTVRDSCRGKRSVTTQALLSDTSPSVTSQCCLNSLRRSWWFAAHRQRYAAIVTGMQASAVHAFDRCLAPT